MSQYQFLFLNPPTVDEIDGQDIYVQANKWDKPLFNSYLQLSSNWYWMFTTGATERFLITGREAQSDGRMKLTVTGDISGYSTADRGWIKEGNGADNYTTEATLIAAMNNDGSDGAIVLGNDDNSAYLYLAALSTGQAAWSFIGGYRFCECTFDVSGNNWLYLNGDCSPITTKFTIENLTFTRPAGVITWFPTSQALSGAGFSLRRLRTTGGNTVINTNANSDLSKCDMQFIECKNTSAPFIIGSNGATINNITISGGFRGITGANKTGTFKNAVFSNVAEDGYQQTNFTFSNCITNNGVIGTKMSLDELETWATKTHQGTSKELVPAAITSPLHETGVDGTFFFDLNGETIAPGEFPTGAYKLQLRVDPDVVTEACTNQNGDYHETTVAEVEDGVLFGANSALEGELAIPNPLGVIESEGGLYHESTVEEVQQYVMFGPNSTYEGEYAPTGVLPTTPVITAVNNEDGTATLSIVCDLGTDNELYIASKSNPSSWALESSWSNTISDTKEVIVTDDTGGYWAAVYSNTGSAVASGIGDFTITNASNVGTLTSIVNAVAIALEDATFSESVTVVKKYPPPLDVWKTRGMYMYVVGQNDPIELDTRTETKKTYEVNIVIYKALDSNDALEFDPISKVTDEVKTLMFQNNIITGISWLNTTSSPYEGEEGLRFRLMGKVLSLTYVDFE